MSTLTDLINEYPVVKSSFFAWVGQNATTGRAHPITGNHSMYGKYVAFDNKAERDEFVENYYDMNGNKFARKVTPHTGRKYSLGKSLVSYIEELAGVASGWSN